MKLSFKKSKTIAVLLIAVITLNSIFITSNTAKAIAYNTLLEEQATAYANTSKTYTFDISISSDIYLDILVPTPVGMALSVNTANFSTYISSFNWEIAARDTDGNPILYDYPLSWTNPSIGSHTLSITFDVDTSYTIVMEQIKPEASISNDTLSLTKGFSKNLSVTNATVSEWSSSNPKVASVDSNGKVTGKSIGSATITAITTDEQTLTCTVSVKENAYSRAKISKKETSYGKAYISISKVSYNRKGDLVIKATYLNNCGHKMSRLIDTKISVKNKSGKVIGIYSKDSQKANIKQGGQKTFTYTIKKASLKIKKTQDLRSASVKTSWGYNYVY